MSKVPYVITDRTATLYINGESFPVDRSTEAFSKLTVELNMEDHDIEAIKNILTIHETNEIEIMDPDNTGRIEVRRRGVYYDGRLINTALAARMLDIQQAGLPLDPWIAFMANVYDNPADYAQDELYLWLEKSTLPITSDGCFLAYKRVKEDFKDIYTGRMDNSPGTTVEMPGGRSVVDTDRNQTCSVGLHFCSKSYLPHFGAGAGNKVVLVKINPRDVVSIPADYDNAKGRTWKYDVIAEVDWDIKEREFSPISFDNGEDWFRFDPNGFDPNGFDSDGFDENGFDENGFDCDGRDSDGLYADGFDHYGLDPNGFDSDGFDENGFDENGFDEDGRDADGFDENGFDENGRDADEFDTDGFDEDGFDHDGFDEDGFDNDGFDHDGFDEFGRDRQQDSRFTVWKRGISDTAGYVVNVLGPEHEVEEEEEEEEEEEPDTDDFAEGSTKKSPLIPSQNMANLGFSR
jgi:hypothetical protein